MKTINSVSILRKILHLVNAILIASSLHGGYSFSQSSASSYTTVTLDMQRMAGCEGGNVNISFNPSKNQILAVNHGGIDNCNLYESLDNGLTWSLFESNGISIAGNPGIRFAHNNSNIVFGWDGPVVKSTDGGITWNNFTLPSGNCTAMTTDPLNDSILYVADNCKMYKSLDGGENWTDISNGLPDLPGSNIWKIIVNNSNAYALHQSRGVYKLTDGSNSWSLLYGIEESEYGSEYAKDFHISPDGQKIWIGISDDLYYSVNAGTDFELRYSFGSKIANIEVNPINDKEVLIVSCDFLEPTSIFKSTDEGITFQSVFEFYYCLSNVIKKFEFSPYDSNVVILSCLGGSGILRSSDAGETWTFSNTGLYGIPIDKMISDENDSTLYAITNDLSGSTKLYTYGTDNTWQERNVYNNWWGIEDIAASKIDKNTMWIAGQEGLFKSTNHSASFVKIAEITMCRSIALTENNDIFVGTDNGELYYSSDKLTWNVILTVTSSLLCIEIDPDDSDIIYVGTNSGHIYKSIDKGATWTQITGLPGRVNCIKIDKNNTNILYAGTENGIYRSTNAGQFWELLGADEHVSSLELDPEESTIIYAGYNNSRFEFSTDNGVTWNVGNLIGNSSNSWIESIVFRANDNNRFYIATSSIGLFEASVSRKAGQPVYSLSPGEYDSTISLAITCQTASAKIYYTVDGMEPTENSTEYTTPLIINNSTTIKSVACRSGYTNSPISEATYLITSVDVKDNNNSPVPDKFKLYQNYPNPFNPLTIIRYNVAKAAHVSIKIYNLRGQLVTTLLNSMKGAGFHTIQWDGRNSLSKPVASGIYLVRMEAGNFTAIQKITLTK